MNADGSADTSFGSSGIETQSSLPIADGLVLSANGDILAAGVSGLDFEVAALNTSTGSLDSSYGTSGVASVAVSSNGSSFTFYGIAAAPDGDLILTGYYNTMSGSTTVHHVDLVAITSAGLADSSFGTSGVDQVSSTSSSPVGTQYHGPLAVDSSGRIYLGLALAAAGLHGVSSSTFTLMRFDPDGAADTSFNTSGSASITDASVRTGPILSILPNGQIVIGAVASTFVLARFNADGTVDTTFGTSGIATGASVSGGLTMLRAPNGEAILIGTPTYGSGVVLQEFHTLSNAQRLYVEQDADYNVTSITDISGNVVERYLYEPYGNVTVLNADGTTRGDGTAASTFYLTVYLHQGLRLDTVSGTYYDRHRIYGATLGRFYQQDPDAYVDGADIYECEMSNPVVYCDFLGLQALTSGSAPSSIADPRMPSPGFPPGFIPPNPPVPPVTPTPPVPPAPNPNAPLPILYCFLIWNKVGNVYAGWWEQYNSDWAKIQYSKLGPTHLPKSNRK